MDQVKSDRGRVGRRERYLATCTVLASGFLAVLVGGSAISLVRDQLHIQCEMGPPGSEGAGTWMCSDGIGYLGVAVTFGGMWIVATLVGSLVAGLVRRPRVAHHFLVVLACAATVWILWWTWYGANELVGDRFAPIGGPEYWQIAVGSAAIVSSAGCAAAVFSLLLPSRFAPLLCGGAASCLIIATLFQPGLGINIVPAAGLLAAAAIHARGVTSPPLNSLCGTTTRTESEQVSGRP